jgi:hypothetical protein
MGLRELPPGRPYHTERLGRHAVVSDQQMTVSQLIAALWHFPQDAKVFVLVGDLELEAAVVVDDETEGRVEHERGVWISNGWIAG